MPRPRAVALDIIETTFSLSALDVRFLAIGLSPRDRDLWFAETLHDTFALAATGAYAPFSQVAGQALRALGARRGRALTPDDIEHVLMGFATLEPHPDAAAALHRLTDEGVRIVALTNGAAAATRTLLRTSGLEPLIARVLSTDEVGAFKPCAEVYRRAADALDVRPADMVLIATHGWDVHGARSAGLASGFVRRGQAYSNAFLAPDVEGESLEAVVDAVLGL
jgi:2-haloacid dehalogenase